MALCFPVGDPIVCDQLDNLLIPLYYGSAWNYLSFLQDLDFLKVVSPPCCQLLLDFRERSLNYLALFETSPCYVQLYRSWNVLWQSSKVFSSIWECKLHQSEQPVFLICDDHIYPCPNCLQLHMKTTVLWILYWKDCISFGPPLERWHAGALVGLSRLCAQPASLQGQTAFRIFMVGYTTRKWSFARLWRQWERLWHHRESLVSAWDIQNSQIVSICELWLSIFTLTSASLSASHTGPADCIKTWMF